MIYIGFDAARKEARLAAYLKTHDCERHVWMVGADMAVPDGYEKHVISVKESIMYRSFYPYMNGIGKQSLLVLNEILYTSNPSTLEYNCIRHFAQQAGHRLVFQRFPLIKEKQDFMILWSMDQENPFLKERYNAIEVFRGVSFAADYLPKLKVTRTAMTGKQMEKYGVLKEKTIEAVRRDPEIIPRRLLKYSEECNEKNEGRRFDSKSELLPRMEIAVNQSKVDQWFYADLKRKMEEMEDVAGKVQ